MLPHLTLSVFVAEGNVNFTLQTNSLVTALCLPGDFDKCLLTLLLTTLINGDPDEYLGGDRE